MKIFAVLALFALLVLNDSLFVVKQTQQALVLEFGKSIKVIQEPGLKFKMPFVQNVILFDNRLIGVSVDQKEVIASDRKRLVVDAYVRYRITDPLKFYQTVSDERIMESRLNSIVESSLRQVIGSVPLGSVISAERSNIMKTITAIVNAQVSGKPLPVKLIEQIAPVEAVPAIIEGQGVVPTDKDKSAAPVVAAPVPQGGFGIEVVDTRIMRADLPPENSKAIFQRMQTERKREAQEFRSKGEEEAQGIRAKAERNKTEILAEAQKKAQQTRGEGDAEASRIFAEAFTKDPNFYAFYRTMQAYRTSIKKDDTTVLMSPDGEFLKYLNRSSSSNQ